MSLAVKIRLTRKGRKNLPSYRIVVADSRFPRDGRFIEELGFYDPKTEPSTVEIKVDKARDWLAKGAQPSNTVRNLFKIAGVIETIKKRTVKVKPTKKEKSKPATEAV